MAVTGTSTYRLLFSEPGMVEAR